MHRRSFLAASIAAILITLDASAAENKRFVFKIKTKSGGVVGNIVIEAKDTSRCSPPGFLMCDEGVRVLRQAALRLGELEVVSATFTSS